MAAKTGSEFRKCRTPAPVLSVVAEALRVGYGVFGLSLAVGVLVGAGFLADRLLGTMPLLTAAAVVLGLTGGALSVRRLSVQVGRSSAHEVQNKREPATVVAGVSRSDCGLNRGVQAGLAGDVQANASGGASEAESN